jgi:Flp pilus assembly protein TadG
MASESQAFHRSTKQKLSRALARFSGAKDGIVAVEFAVLLPFMLTLFLGSVEVSTAAAIHRKVMLTAHTLADLASQSTSISSAEMSNILSASTAIIAPYASGGLQSTVSEVSINGSGVATVVWSYSQNGTPLTVGSTVNVPSSLATPNSYLLLGQAQYTYNPPYGYVITGPVTMSEQMFLMPRQSTSVAITS